MSTSPSPTQPAWTIVIPTHNRPEQLRQTVEAAQRLDPPPGGFEIFVIDDGGEANLSFLNQYHLVRHHRQSNAGPAGARNTGARVARGRYLAFTDDDCRPTQDWLLKFHAALNEHPNSLLGGHTVNALTHNPYSAASQDVVDYLYEVENRDPNDARFFASNNVATSREAFLEVGGFDETYPLAAGEDRAFCRRWRQTNRTLTYIPAATVHHHHRLTLRSFWRQHVRYGQGAYRFHGEQPRIPDEGKRAKSKAIGLYLKLIGYPYHSDVDSLRLPRLVLLSISQVATTVGYMKQAWHSP